VLILSKADTHWTEQVLKERELLRGGTEPGTVQFLTSGDPALVAPVIRILWGDEGEGVTRVDV
jgi:hypothetical protein